MVYAPKKGRVVHPFGNEGALVLEFFLERLKRVLLRHGEVAQLAGAWLVVRIGDALGHRAGARSGRSGHSVVGRVYVGVVVAVDGGGVEGRQWRSSEDLLISLNVNVRHLARARPKTIS